MSETQVVNVNGVSSIDKTIRVVERLGVTTAIVGYFLYKDWVFTEKLVATLAQLIITQNQMAEAVQKIAEAGIR